MKITYKHVKTGKRYRWIDKLGHLDVFQELDTDGLIKSFNKVYFNGFDDLEIL